MPRNERPRSGKSGKAARQLARVDTVGNKLIATFAARDKDSKRIKQEMDETALNGAFGKDWKRKLDRGHQTFVPGDPVGSAGTWVHSA